MKKIIQAENLNKSFKQTHAVNNVTFDVYEGEILCILGPNGAGKTTTINMLTTAMPADGGSISFGGRNVSADARAYKQKLGVVPQDVSVFEELSAERNIAFFASLYGLRGQALKTAVDMALDFAGLTDRRKDKVKTYSGGMKRRLNIACAIAHDPEIIIMDEPTVGIDPQSRNHILTSIRRLQGEGATVIYTTHYMEEVEEISTRIIIMDNGCIIAEGTKKELKEKLADERLYSMDIGHTESLDSNKLYRIAGVKEAGLEGTNLKISVLKGIENLDKIISLLIDSGVKINNITSETASLEMVFLKLTGHNLRD